MKTIYLIRHGESENNRYYDHLIGGIAKDVPLTRLGRLQAASVGQKLHDEAIQIDRAYSSTALRAMETGDLALNGSYPLEKIVHSDELLEMDRGEYTGRIRREVYTPELISVISKDPWNHKPPGGESQRDVETRMMKFIQKNILDAYDDKHENIAIFGHGYAIKCLFRGIMDSDPGMTFKIGVDNASVTEFRYDTKGWHLIRLNDTSHLFGLEYLL